MRLLVQEFEVLPGAVAGSDGTTETFGAPGQDIQRLCYFDVIEL
jgi:hypothetical protein